MQLNDMVCVLFGGPMPFILHQGATPSENKLREEAFVNELMKGKVVELWRAGELECKDFRLRHCRHHLPSSFTFILSPSSSSPNRLMELRPSLDLRVSACTF
ncbi:hypothetical protein HGRIS_001448 [Hohenbuehelia grisea]|uniref:Uncharacterized protein n=1 Tax=Hohenbuehelia grisea TaxID=104357 RepID=A0ABR3JQD2_9AGAR